MKTQVAMHRFLCFLLPIILIHCSENPIQEDLDHSLLEIKTLSLNNITINNYWVSPNLGTNERLYLGTKNNINVPYSFIQIEDSVYLDYYNDSTINVDSLRFIMYSTDTLIETSMLNLYFSPDSKFNENTSIYSDFMSLSNDEFLELGYPEIQNQYDFSDNGDTINTYTEFTWNIDTLIDIFADTLDNDPFNSFMLIPPDNAMLMEFYSEEATSGTLNNKDPKVIVYFRRTYLQNDSTIVEADQRKIYSVGDLSVFDPTEFIYNSDQVGLCNGTGMRSIINIPIFGDSIPQGSLIRTANLFLPYDTNRTAIHVAQNQRIVIDPLDSDTINIDSTLFNNSQFDTDPFSGVGYPYRAEDNDITSINNGIYRIDIKEFIQGKVLGNTINSSWKLVSIENNNPFEHIWLSNSQNDTIKIEIIYVKN